MDNLLLLTPLNNSHIAKLGRLIEGIVKDWFENISKEMPVI